MNNIELYQLLKSEIFVSFGRTVAYIHFAISILSPIAWVKVVTGITAVGMLLMLSSIAKDINARVTMLIKEQE